jgi:hypothetical protein
LEGEDGAVDIRYERNHEDGKARTQFKDLIQKAKDPISD